MESPTSHTAIMWTGGFKDWVDGNQRKPPQNEYSFYDIDDSLEPTSVLDVGHRFSPPLECICAQQTEPGSNGWELNSHPDPSCPHAQVHENSYIHPIFIQTEQLLSHHNIRLPVACPDTPSWRLFQDPYEQSTFHAWGDETRDDNMLQANDAGLWVDQDGQLLVVPYIEKSNSSNHCDLQHGPMYGTHAVYNNSNSNNEMRLAEPIALPDFPLALPSSNKLDLETGDDVDENVVESFVHHGEDAASGELQCRNKAISKCKSLSSIGSGGMGSCSMQEESEPHFSRMLSYSQGIDLLPSSSKRSCMALSQDKTGMISRPAKRFSPHAEAAIVAGLSSCKRSEESITIGKGIQTDTMNALKDNDNDYDDMHHPHQDHGLHLVHLLLACAEAVAWRDTHLANLLLDELFACTSHSSDAIQRVTYYFAEGLSARLATMCGGLLRPITVQQRKEGLLQLYHCSPYLAFGFFAANEAILQAFEKKTQVHIIDLGMMLTLQWPGLIRALARRPEGPPMSLRITAASGAGIATVEEMNQWGHELKDFARSLQVPLEFQALSESLDISNLNATALGVREGETLAINSVLQLHRVVKESRGSLKKALQCVHKLSPAVMTLVEQDGSHNGPFFLGRFLESLHYYSAIFDSLEASLPRHSKQRMKVERLHFADEIRNIVACEGLERVERHERGDQWRRHMSRAGFHGVPLNFMSQARMLLSLYSCDGYTLKEEKGFLLLGWKNRPIILASAWKSSPPSSASRLSINKKHQLLFK